MYKLNKSGIMMLKSIKKMTADQIMIVLPGKAKIRESDNGTYGIGGCVKTTKEGEQFSVPLMFGMEAKFSYEEEDVYIIVASSEFERAVEVASINSPDEIAMELIPQIGFLDVRGGSMHIKVPCSDKNAVHLPSVVQLGEMNEALNIIQFRTEAFVRRAKMCRNFSDEVLELRESDGELVFFPKAHSWMIFMSEFDQSEFKVQKRTEKIRLLINTKYMSIFDGSYYGEFCTLAIFERGFVFSSNGTTLIGLVPETASVSLYPEGAITTIKANAAANYDCRFQLPESKKLQNLLSIWEEDLKGRSKNVKNVSVRLSVNSKGLHMDGSPLLSYAAPIRVIAQPKDTGKEYYFARPFLSKVFGAFSNAQFSLVSQGNNSALYAENFTSKIEGEEQGKAGDFLLLMGVLKSAYDEMCSSLVVELECDQEQVETEK